MKVNMCLIANSQANSASTCYIYRFLCTHVKFPKRSKGMTLTHSQTGWAWLQPPPAWHHTAHSRQQCCCQRGVTQSLALPADQQVILILTTSMASENTLSFMIRVFKNDIIHIVTACLVRYCVYSARRGINITLHTVNQRSQSANQLRIAALYVQMLFVVVCCHQVEKCLLNAC